MNPFSKILESLAPAQLRVGMHVAGASIAVLIATVSYSFFYVADTDRETGWEMTIVTGKELLEHREQIAQARDVAECELFAMNERLKELTALIPGNPESSRFLAQLAQLGGESELQINNFRPGPPESANNMRRIRVQLSATGRYECICRFLDGLQSLPRLTRVVKLDVAPLNQEDLYPVQMELAIFFSADSPEPTKVARND